MELNFINKKGKIAYFIASILIHILVTLAYTNSIANEEDFIIKCCHFIIGIV